MKKLIYYISIVLTLAACQNNEDIWMKDTPSGKESLVTITMSPIEADYSDIITRGVEDYTGETIQELLYSLQYIVTDADSNFVARGTLTTEDIADFQSLNLSLDMGHYTLYMLGEGLNTSLMHTTEELREPTTINDMWYHNIRFQPVRREVFYAQQEFTVDGSGMEIALDVELRRQVGMLDINVECSDETFKFIGLNLLIPDAYAANYMTVDGQFGFDMNDTDGTGFYWKKNIGYGNAPIPVEGETYRARFFMFPTLADYMGENVPSIIFTYLLGTDENNLYNKEISLKDLKIEANHVTTINITVE